jgi:hypothetical protein
MTHLKLKTSLSFWKFQIVVFLGPIRSSLIYFSKIRPSLRHYNEYCAWRSEARFYNYGINLERIGLPMDLERLLLASLSREARPSRTKQNQRYVDDDRHVMYKAGVRSWPNQSGSEWDTSE